MFESLQPYDSQAEESVVASILVDETLMNRLAPVLDAGDITPDFSLNYGLINGKIQREIKVPERCVNSLGRDTDRSEPSMQDQPTRPQPNRPHVDYYRYIASREWALKKRQIIERSAGNCERCKLSPAVNVHHLTYRFLGDEPLDDLIHVCAGCHSFLHGHSDIDPKPERIYLNEHEWAELQDKPWFQLMMQGVRR